MSPVDTLHETRARIALPRRIEWRVFLISSAFRRRAIDLVALLRVDGFARRFLVGVVVAF